MLIADQIFTRRPEISCQTGPKSSEPYPNCYSGFSRSDENVNRIRTAIQGLAKSPPEGDILPLQGYSDGRKRLRVGGWRVIYRCDRDGELEVLLIIDIGNRGDVYK